MRRLFLGVFCFSLAVTAYYGWLLANAGVIGLTLHYSPAATTITVARGSAAYDAGLRTGQVVDLGRLPNAARYRFHEGIVAGERFAIPVESRAGIHIVQLIARPAGGKLKTAFAFAGYLEWFAYAGLAWLVLFGALLVWRRDDSAEARTLASLLMLLPCLIFLQAENGFYTPWIGVDLAANALGSLTTFSAALLATYAMLFRLPHPSVRMVLAALAYATGVAWVVFTLVAMERAWLGLAPPPQTRIALIGVGCLFSLLCAIVTARQSTGEQRIRIAWVTASVGIIYGTETVIDLVGFVIPSLHQVGSVVRPIAYFVAPIGLWCSLLNRRVLDIGFAINRAAVFTGVSVVVVGIFVLVEWALSEWFSSASHTTNLAISAALALALGLSVRAIHMRVDRVLDTVFFRKRHEDEQAIRTLAREAAYITEPNVLLSRTIAVLEEHADATSVNILLEGGDRYTLHHPERSRGTVTDLSVSENDPAIVRLRATQKVLDLHDVQTAITGEFAHPMLARGRLVGVLVLGPKRSGESYAPDESDAIAQLAHDVGAALDVLGIKKNQIGDPLREEVRAMCELLKSLPQQIGDALGNQARLV